MKDRYWRLSIHNLIWDFALEWNLNTWGFTRLPTDSFGRKTWILELGPLSVTRR